MSHVPISLTSKFNVKLMWHQCGINFLLTGESHADGTFKSNPRKYKQMYLTQAWYKGHMYLCAKIFFKNKDEATYTRMLWLKMQKIVDLNCIQRK